MSLRARTPFPPASRYFHLLPPLSVALAAWGLGVLGAFRATDGPSYDAFLRLRSRGNVSPPAVLLLEVDDGAQAQGEEDMLSLLRRLEGLGARQILFNFAPRGAQEDFYRAASEAGNVLFGRGLSVDPSDPSQLVLAEAPELERRPGIPLGIVQSPPAAGGICRSQYDSVEVAGVRYPLLEACAAAAVLGHPPVEVARPFLIDFRGGPGSLPNATSSRLRSGDLIEELVKGRSVIVGLRTPAGAAGYHTPTTSGQQTMTLLEYEGQALDTLLSERCIVEPGRAARLALVIAAVLCCAGSYRVVSIRTASWLTAGWIGLYGIGAAGALVYGRTWLPVTEVAAAQAAFFLILVRQRALQLTVSLTNLISDSASNLRDKYWPVNPCGAATPWSLVANMINQTLDLKRLIFLEADTRARQVREILALHCSLKDIAERRRDYTRPPYRDAISAKGPIVVEGFLSTSDENERQYLIPLSFCGDLLGFWAIGIESGKIAAIPEFEGLLLDYTARISELLHHASESGRGRVLEGAAPLGLPGEDAQGPQNDLSSTLGLLQQRLGAMDALVNSLSCGVIVLDIFGRLLQINEIMLSLLKKENLVPFEMTALDIIMALSDYDISKARKLLRRVIVENGEVSFPVTFRSLPGSRFLFHLKPLVDAPRKDGKDRLKHLGTRSILCELVETTSMAILYEMKSRLTDRLCVQLRADLAPVELALSMVAGGGASPDERREMAELVQSKIRQTVRILSECQQYLALDADVDDLERFPVDPKGPLTVAVEEMQAELGSRALSIQVIQPNFISYVFASAGKLKEFFKAILAVLSQDAAENSAILARMIESDDVVAIDFSNMGFGIPNDLLQQYVFGGQAVASSELQTIQSGAKWVQAWGGMLEAFSGVGVGMHFTVHLVKFL